MSEIINKSIIIKLKDLQKTKFSSCFFEVCDDIYSIRNKVKKKLIKNTLSIDETTIIKFLCSEFQEIEIIEDIIQDSTDMYLMFFKRAQKKPFIIQYWSDIHIESILHREAVIHICGQIERKKIKKNSFMESFYKNHYVDDIKNEIYYQYYSWLEMLDDEDIENRHFDDEYYRDLLMKNREINRGE